MYFKKAYVYILVIASFLTSCDDGDIIITSFEFDDATLEICNGSEENEFVFFKINTENNEAISFNFISDALNLTSETETPLTFDLSDENTSLVYRQFNIGVTNDYFCSIVPSGEIIVTQELIGISGVADIETEIVLDDDQDQIPSELEDINGDGDLENDDTDGDGIPNYKDEDDDNDNVLTSAELDNGDPNDDSFRNSDDDDIPDYLDDDDDNDGIKTINEDIDGDGSPRDTDDRNAQGQFFYLDENSTNSNNTVSPNPENTTVRTTYRTTVNISTLRFDGTNENFENENFSFGFRDVQATRDLRN